MVMVLMVILLLTMLLRAWGRGLRNWVKEGFQGGWGKYMMKFRRGFRILGLRVVGPRLWLLLLRVGWLLVLMWVIQGLYLPDKLIGKVGSWYISHKIKNPLFKARKGEFWRMEVEFMLSEIKMGNLLDHWEFGFPTKVQIFLWRCSRSCYE